MSKAVLKGVAEVWEAGFNIEIEFGRTQASMKFSDKGSIARKLKLKDGDSVEVTIKKVK